MIVSVFYNILLAFGIFTIPGGKTSTKLKTIKGLLYRGKKHIAKNV